MMHMPKQKFVAIEQAIGDELILYHPQTRRAYSLSPTAAQVYRACDGATLQSQVALSLGKEGRDLLQAALDRLATEGLIEAEGSTTLDRRRFLTRVALLPVVSSVLAPEPTLAASGSCLMSGFSGCATSSQPAGPPGAPTGCVDCCDNSPTCACPADCGKCVCVAAYRCSDDGINPIPCNTATGPSICHAGSTDFFDSRTCGSVPDFGAIEKDCDAARIATSFSTLYACCRC
ncbi:MAG: PqqD family protein [Vulcanimicrobiota bacterium]